MNKHNAYQIVVELANSMMLLNKHNAYETVVELGNIIMIKKQAGF